MEGVTSNLLTTSGHNTAPHGIQQYESPFRILDATIINTKLKKKMILDIGAAQADQGSDIYLISDLLASTLSLESREIPGVRGFMMQTADGNLTTLQTFAIFKFGVAGIWRTVHTYIRPNPKPGKDTFSLLLGLSCLFSVKATINIYENCIAIGDPVSCPKDRKRQIIRFAAWESSPHQQLMLVPGAVEISQVKKP
ncbi:hypothetical protein GcM1_147002 [Golovinomyces cichoracearum]|uniref:Uncharacterized protein n=1 Tax=Golovinomyces cichoracearum TaxID=62708 RepID=A0A420JB76_9PEZI|nr:hypothetical protein GcM1_147002 [Golovinomyces cichoracearum]